MDKFDGITPGITDQRVLTVEEEHTVSPAGTSVLSTPMMIAWMEITSADLVRPFFPPVSPLWDMKYRSSTKPLPYWAPN